MTLLVLMYHRGRADRHGNPLEVLDAHFAHIAVSCRNVLPGERLAADALNVCLSFDDGYFDFYANVFPLLKKHSLRALLAIPPSLIRERVDAQPADRIAIETPEAFAHPSRGGFCTWPELEEMAHSGHVTVAAHGYTHQRLDQPDADLATEIHVPKIVLGSRFRKKVESFAFPFGRCSSRAIRDAGQSYQYLFRIGGASNSGWRQRLLYRVDADRMATSTSLFEPGRLARYRWRYFWNRLRLR